MPEETPVRGEQTVRGESGRQDATRVVTGPTEARFEIPLPTADSRADAHARVEVACHDCEAPIVSDTYKGDTVIRCAECDSILLRRMG